MGFKDRLREKRVEANLTQAALAEKVSVTARTIQNYELGSRKPTKYEVVKKIAEALNTTPEYLLGREELPYFMKSDFSATDIEIINLLPSLSDDDKLILYDTIRELYEKKFITT